MKTAEYWIEKLNLKQHPEGGFFAETYRSAEKIAQNALSERFEGERDFGTAIYFLLRSEDISAFHRIKSDEIWFYHAGNPVEIFFLDKNGTNTIVLGPDFENGESFQLVVPANTWFGAKVKSSDGFVLVSCTVSPGFHFDDFELGERTKLLVSFPKSQKEIELLTKP